MRVEACGCAENGKCCKGGKLAKGSRDSKGSCNAAKACANHKNITVVKRISSVFDGVNARRFLHGNRSLEDAVLRNQSSD